MKLKVRLSILFAVVFAGITLLLNAYIYFSYADFRREEFFQRLRTKAVNTLHLLEDLQEIDAEKLRVIGQNTLNPLYEEKIYIFDNQHQLVYSSIDSNHAVSYSERLLNQIEEKQYIEYIDADNQHEQIGLKTKYKGHDYIILASAYDNVGRRKLQNLIYTLLIASFMGIVIGAVTGYMFMQRAFKPIEVLSYNIKSITERNLQQLVPVNPRQNDEIAELAYSFNQMLQRLDAAFDSRKAFVRHASHELRTPIARMMSDAEQALGRNLSEQEYKAVLQVLVKDLDQLSELINSLLLLSRTAKLEHADGLKPERIDDILFETIDKAMSVRPNLKVSVEFLPENLEASDIFSLSCDKSLISTVFINMLENAAKYAPDQKVNVYLDEDDEMIYAYFINGGKTLTPEEQGYLFTPFFRASNSASQVGHGLGLSICNRVARYYGGYVQYSISAEKQNQFLVTFSKKMEGKNYYTEI